VARQHECEQLAGSNSAARKPPEQDQKLINMTTDPEIGQAKELPCGGLSAAERLENENSINSTCLKTHNTQLQQIDQVTAFLVPPGAVSEKVYHRKLDR
jgi:hypothetical protein